MSEVIIQQNAGKVCGMDTGCKSMFKNQKLDELSDMYTLFSKVDTTLSEILNEMGPYIEGRGQSLVDDIELKKDPVKFTEILLQLKKEMDDMVTGCFKNNAMFNQNRDKSFQVFMNKWGETPHAMAAYCDNFFRVSIKQMSEEQIEQSLDAIIRLFCCLHNRDIFIKAYSKFQADRLLKKSSQNTEKEQSMISKLKVECGFSTVSKLSRMFTDMDLSKKVLKEFKDKNSGGVVNGVKISADILTQGIWPD